MDANITIRVLTQSDKNSFVKLMNDYVQEYVKFEKTYPVYFDPKIGDAYWRDINERPEDYLTVVAETNGDLRGFCIGEIHRYGIIEKVYFHGDKRGEVWDIYVDPLYRNIKIGELMIQEIEKQFVLKGCEDVIMNGVDIENTGARKLYKRLGYKEWCIRCYKQISLGGSTKPIVGHE
jgi:ribosomal protein S18 acetylase RimI-like enzyme